MNNGLTIGREKIKILSGPIDYYYLKPIDSKYPLILLLGDLHMGDFNTCEPCKLPDCYRVFDQLFLDLLDKVGQEYDVNLFLEVFGWEWEKHTIDNSNSSLAQLIKKGKHCFIKDSNCPTKNIKWHFGDPRMNSAKWEGIFVAFITEFQNLTPDDRSASKTILKVLTERGFDIDLIKEIQTVWKQIHKVISTNNFDLKMITDIMFNSFEKVNRKSLIYKQIQNSGIEIDIWKKCFLRGLDYYVMYSPIPTEQLTYDTIFIFFKNTFFNVFVDMYVLSRMNKSPNRGISIAMLGSNHCRSIIIMLTELNKYELVSFYSDLNNIKQKVHDIEQDIIKNKELTFEEIIEETKTPLLEYFNTISKCVKFQHEINIDKDLSSVV